MATVGSMIGATRTNRWLRRCTCRLAWLLAAHATLSTVGAILAGEVFVYYANGTCPDAVESVNYDVIIGWLASASSPKARETAVALDRDRRLFSAAVEAEQSAILATAKYTNLDIDCVVVTNEMLRSGSYKLCRAVDREVQTRTFPAPVFDNYIVTSNPLSDRKVFRDFLGEVAGVFNPASHDFVLVTKSHGSTTHAFTPRVVVRHEETSRDELISLLSGAVPHAERPPWLGRLGIRKEDYLGVLEDVGETLGMRFSVVVAEACDGVLDPHLRALIPPNVRALCVIDEFTAQYTNVLYADLIQQGAPKERFSDLVLDAVRDKFDIVSPPSTGAVGSGESQRSLPIWKVSLFFVPLAVWLGAVAWIQVSKYRQRQVSLAKRRSRDPARRA